MTAYNNPKIVPIPNPVGVDAAIEACRVSLAALPWLQTIFGRAIFQHAKEDKAETIFPEVWGPNREPLNVMVNDNLKSYAFFVARDPERVTDFAPFASQLYMQKPVSIIVWANLQKIDNTRKYRFGEWLKMDLMKRLSIIPAFVPTMIYEAYNRVFEGFTITENFRTYLKPPYWAIRIDGNMSFTAFPENCGIDGAIPGDFNEDYNNDFTNLPGQAIPADFNNDYNNDYTNQPV